MNNFFSELSRRNVFRVAAAYVIVGWIVLQVVGLLAPNLGLPAWTVALIFVIILSAFPIALLLTWAFEMTPEGVKKTEAIADASTSTGRMDYMLVGAAVLLALVGVFTPSRTVIETAADNAPVAEVAIEEHDVMPSFTLAVLPFENFSDDKQLGWIADGISEDVLTQLSYIPRLGLAARNSSFQFKGQNIDIRTIGKQLNVRYVLEGSIRKQGEALRITAQLIETETGNHIWADQFNPALSEISSLHDIVIGEMVTSVASILTKTEYDRLSGIPIEDLAGIDLVNMAAVSLLSGNGEAARRYADLAVKKAPELSTAHGFRAVSLLIPTALSPSALSSENGRKEILREVDLALSATDINAQSYVAIATALDALGDHQRAKAHAEFAAELAPNHPGSHFVVSQSERGLGNYSAALEAAQACIANTHRSGPYYPSCHRMLATIQNALQLYDDAYETLQRPIYSKSDYLVEIERIVTLVGKGEIEEAQRSVEEMRTGAVGLSSYADQRQFDENAFSDPAYIEIRANAYRQAGWE